MQRILSTMMTSRKVKLTPANENSSVVLTVPSQHWPSLIMSTKGGSAICVRVRETFIAK